MATKSPLRLLGEIITSSIDIIESRLAEASVDFPSLNEPFCPTNKAESVLLEPDVLTPISHIIAAASQLIATVRHPAQTVIDDAASYHIASCMRAIIDSDTVEIVREAGPQGIHVNEIARQNKTDPAKLSRLLRLLANHYIFTEVAPDVFATNRLSSMIDSGKSTKELTARPKEKHIGTSGIAAFVLLCADEIMKGAAYLPEVFTNPDTSRSVQPGESPWNMAFNTDKPVFTWYDEKENEDRRKRFSVAISGTTKMEPPDAILKGFQWQTLPTGGLLVDVGGGVGSSSLLIAQATTHINVVVQDRLIVTDHAEQYWKDNFPEALASGRAKFQAHDFFKPQPIKDADAFLLRFIAHDWADPFAKEILQNLREAAKPETKLIVVDVIVPYTCHASITDEIPGAALSTVPKPLLPSLGEVNNMAYWLDLHVFVLCNGQDRTLGHFVQLAAASGWKVTHVHHIPGSAFGQYVCVPV